jgi:hypothetical protein
VYVDIISRPAFTRNSFSKTGSCACFQVEPTQLGPIERAGVRTEDQQKTKYVKRAEHKPWALVRTERPAHMIAIQT